MSIYSIVSNCDQHMTSTLTLELIGDLFWDKPCSSMVKSCLKLMVSTPYIGCRSKRVFVRVSDAHATRNVVLISRARWLSGQINGHFPSNPNIVTTY